MARQLLISTAPTALIILIFMALALLIIVRRRPRNTKLRDMRGQIIGIVTIGLALFLASLAFAPPPTDPSEFPSQ